MRRLPPPDRRAFASTAPSSTPKAAASRAIAAPWSLPTAQAIPIADTRKGDDGNDVLHIPAEDGVPLPAVGTAVTAEIDWNRRHRLMRMHSCMHLLCAVVSGDVTGGQVGTEKSRLDFNLPDTKLDKEAIAAALNRLIVENHPVQARWISEDELAAQPELVRTMSVKPPMGSGRVRVLGDRGCRPAALRRHARPQHRGDRPGAHRQDREQRPAEPAHQHPFRRLTEPHCS